MPLGKDSDSLRADMVVAHLVLLVTAQGTDPVLVDRLICHFTHLIRMGFVGVIVDAGLAR